MSAQDIIALIVVAAAALYVLRGALRTLSGKSDCGCGSGKACTRDTKPAPDQPTGVRFVRLIPLEQVGTPTSARETPTARDTDSSTRVSRSPQ